MKLGKRQIPGFEIIEAVATGGMGSVFKARQVSLNKTVALKILSPKLARDKKYIDRFMREAKSLAKLNHPNVVAVIDVGKGGGHYYLVMEYVSAGSLADIIDEEGALQEENALRMARQIACALQHAQQNSLIHRDIKPENVLISADGVCKLCDLGLARLSGGSSSLTATGVAMGTPDYISPEQARGESEIDIRADIYSLGATLFHAVCGKPPYEGPTPAHVMSAHISDQVAFPSKPKLSGKLRRFIEKMMAKDPARRQQTAEELIRDIDLVLAGKRVKKSSTLTEKLPSLKVPQKIRRHLAIGGGAAAVAVLAVILLALLVPPPPASLKEETGAPDSENNDVPPGPARNRGRPRPVPQPTDPPPFIEPRNPAIPKYKPPEAKIAYEAAENFEKTSGTGLETIISKYLDVAESFPETEWGEKAAARALSLEEQGSKLAAEVQEEYNQVYSQAFSKFADHRYHEALALLVDFASRRAGTPAAQSALTYARQVVLAAARAFAEACRKSQELADRGKFAAARETLAAIKHSGVSKLDEIVSEKLREIARKEKDALKGKKAASRAELYEEVLSQIYKGDAGSIEEFIFRAREAASNKKYSPVLDLLQSEENDLASAAEVLAAAEQGLSKRKGYKVQLQFATGGSAWGRIQYIGNGKVGIAPDDNEPTQTVTVSITELADRQILNFASLAPKPPSKASRLHFLTARGDLQKAREILEKSPISPAERKRIEEKLSLLKSIFDERNAGALAARVTRFYQSNRFSEASSAAKELFEKYPHTRFLIDNAKEMGAFIAQQGLLRIHSRSTTFTNPLSVDIDPVPSFSVERRIGGNARTFYIRWEGLLSVPANGDYAFYLMTNGPVKLKLDGHLLLRKSPGPGLEVVYARQKLPRGLRKFEFEYTCSKGKAPVVQIFWQQGNGPRFPLTPADISHLPARRTEYEKKGR